MNALHRDRKKKNPPETTVEHRHGLVEYRNTQYELTRESEWYVR